MAITVDVNGVPIQYPQTGDTGWGDNATKFAEEVASVLGKIGQSQAPVNDDIIVSPGNLSVTSGNLSVGGDASITGNTTLTGNITVNGNSTLGNGTSDTTAITGILNVDSGVLYVDPVNNRVGINDTTPSEALDVTGNLNVTGDITFGGSFVAPLIKASTSAGLGIDNNSGTDVALFGGSGGIDTVLYGGLTGTTGNFANTTDATSSTDGALKTAGGVGIAKKLFVGTDVTVGGVTYLDDNTTANTPVLSFTGDTNTGIGRSGADTLDFITNGNSRFRIESTGQLQAVISGNTTFYPGYLCRAWVNFNGTLSGTISPRGSANISSVVKNSTGIYTINIDTDMPDGNYSVVSSSSYVAAVGQPSSGIQQGTTPTGASFVLQNIYQTTVRDSEFICVGIFR